VLDDAEGFRWLAAHPLRRRVGRDQLGVARLQVLELAHELVVLGIADLRVVQGVVAVIVEGDLSAQLFDACLGRLRITFGSGGFDLLLAHVLSIRKRACRRRA
jgi:hypothetical protein